MSRNPFRKSVGFYQVVSASSCSHGTKGITVYTQIPQMESDYSPTSKDSPIEPSKIVDFTLKDQLKENKKKYLTAKYGAHQMSLIKKRLNVEMWIFDELRVLYNTENDDHDCELELEEILNLDTDNERRTYIMEQIQDAKQSEEVVSKFVDELLKRAKTL